jgi:hypothetical protein
VSISPAPNVVANSPATMFCCGIFERRTKPTSLEKDPLKSLVFDV